MPVHNALPHLDAAIPSVLEQTFTDFELVILDDASTDGSTERLRDWARRDDRIRLLQVTENLGPVGSSNMVARAARAPLVARMDADDLSYPDRLRQQVQIFSEHADAGVVGSLCDMIDAKGDLLRPAEIWRITRRSPFVPFAHGAMMCRRDLFDAVGGYREECAYWEDQDLVVRIAAIAKVYVIPRALYRIRAWTRSTRVASDQGQFEQALANAYAVTDRLQREGIYEGPIEAAVSEGRVDPRVFIAEGSVRLWANERPRLLRRFLSRAQLSVSGRTLVAFVWTAWASASPSTLRRFLTFLLQLRNRATAPGATLNGPVEWVPAGIDLPESERPRVGLSAPQAARSPAARRS